MGETMDRAALEVGLVFKDPDGAALAERDMEFLLEEIQGLAINQLVHQLAVPAPAGARAGEVATYTSVVLGLAGAPALKSMILLAQDWLTRRNSGTIDIKLGEDELHLTSASRADQRRAIEVFTAKAADRSPDA
ncbi:hypothetical protein [Kitasatospora cineracea]|uniref:hypothetical protein n=1 Tax=Kitasatospora cineracea TaxID=88074 RepID=UPI000F502C4F|nr:hypothetical protein [Kitasatospora cineracea]